MTSHFAPRYAELAVTTNFSFLRGASHPEELVATAMALGLAGIGIADRNSLAGIVRAHAFARANKAAAENFRVVERRAARLLRRRARHLELSARSRRLWASDPAAHARQCPGAKRSLHARASTISSRRRKANSSSSCKTAHGTPRMTPSRLRKSMPISMTPISAPRNQS